MRAMHRITAQERDAAFEAINTAAIARHHYTAAKSPESKAFEKDVIRAMVAAARTLRLAGTDYPAIP